MPLGLVLWRWDERMGATIIGKYPSEIEISMKTLMQLYSQHLYTAKADVCTLYLGALNLISMWSGSIYNYFLTLLLITDEDPEKYIEIIPDVLYYLVPYIEDESFSPLLPSLYQRFVEYPESNKEQRLALLLSNDVNRFILSFLEEESFYYKDGLKILLEDRLKTNVFNFDLVIERLSHLDLLKITNIKGVEGTYVFLRKNIAILRAPPLDLMRHSKQMQDPETMEKILENIRNYFRLYRPTNRDNNEILNLFHQSKYYQIIDLLRKTIVPEYSLRKLKLRGMENVFELVRDLQAKDIVDSMVNDKKETIYYLKSDIVITELSPDFMIRRIADLYLAKKRNILLIFGYIRILKEFYLEKQESHRKRQLVEDRNGESENEKKPSISNYALYIKEHSAKLRDKRKKKIISDEKEGKRSDD